MKSVPVINKRVNKTESSQSEIGILTMGHKIGIDVGGTFTDFLLVLAGGSISVYKVLSTPQDPSIAVLRGLSEMAADLDLSLATFLQRVSVIVHGTTVTTNAVLTRTGAKTALVTTKGLRDTLEMRRGVRERQFDNRFKNARPIVARYLRQTVEERIDYKGDVMTPLAEADLGRIVRFLKEEAVEAAAVCTMNAFSNSRHEEAIAKRLIDELPGVYLSVSNRLLPAIRFYDRVSTTVLNAYVGPILQTYLQSLTRKLAHADYDGILLIMQSNGGVISPALAMEKAVTTLLSGPAGGPVAGVIYAEGAGYADCITMDMGGTSFDASLVKGKTPGVTVSGEIDRLKIAMPMLNVVTIGAGGGSLGWIDGGGLLRMGPQSAGSCPGPACYDRGGAMPTCTDADLVLGYLDKDFFAGGRIPLNLQKAEAAIREHIATPLGIEIPEAAAAMYHVINVNMAAAVREVSVKQGYDPRDFPLVVAGGAGPIHACMIALELEIPVMIIPRASSIFCAAGMLLSDLKHDFVVTYPTQLLEADAGRFKAAFADMKRNGRRLLKKEKIPDEDMRYSYSVDLRYAGQYHEVSVMVTEEEVENAAFEIFENRFHDQHDQHFGYSLKGEKSDVTLINLRLICIGRTDKPRFLEDPFSGKDAFRTIKTHRNIYLPMQNRFQSLPVYDGEKLGYGNRISGPAVVEQVNTTTVVTPEYDLMVDACGSSVLYHKDRAEAVESRIQKQGRRLRG